MDFDEFKQKLNVRLIHTIELVKENAEKGARALMCPRVLGVLGLAVTLAIGFGTGDWLVAASGIVIMAAAATMHSYGKREGW